MNLGLINFLWIISVVLLLAALVIYDWRQWHDVHKLVDAVIITLTTCGVIMLITTANMQANANDANDHGIVTQTRHVNTPEQEEIEQ